VLDIRKQLTFCHAEAPQHIRHDPQRHIVQTFQQASEETLGCFAVAAFLTGMSSAMHLVLLCHKMRRRDWRWQQGHLDMLRAMARAMTSRIEVIELGTWRSGRIGGSAGSITVGNGRLFEDKGGA
jgi:hypothetical protein